MVWPTCETLDHCGPAVLQRFDDEGRASRDVVRDVSKCFAGEHSRPEQAPRCGLLQASIGSGQPSGARGDFPDAWFPRAERLLSVRRTLFGRGGHDGRYPPEGSPFAPPVPTEDERTGSKARDDGMSFNRARPRLLTRIVLHGALLVVVVALVFVAAGALLIGPDVARHTREFASWMNSSLCNTRRPPRITDFPVPATLYESDGIQVFASNTTPPLAATAGRQAERGKVPSQKFVVRCAPGKVQAGRVAVIELPAPEPPAILMAILAVIAITLLVPLSIPFARSITKPIEELARATESVGADAIEARVTFERSDEIGELGRAFVTMATRITTLRRAEKELLANVSHELRTPLSRIRVVLELIEDDAELARTYLPEIGRDLRDLEGLVDDILVAARLDLVKGTLTGSELPLHRETISATDLLESVVQRFRTLYPDRLLAVRNELAERTLRGDMKLLRRALNNLLDNAYKYGGEQEISLHAWISPEGNEVFVEVVDLGHGISPEDMAHVFSPFFRADRSRNRSTGGVGLGLPLARRILEAHGGSVSLSSEIGHGTKARVELPLSDDAQIPRGA